MVMVPLVVAPPLAARSRLPAVTTAPDSTLMLPVVPPVESFAREIPPRIPVAALRNVTSAVFPEPPQEEVAPTVTLEPPPSTTSVPFPPAPPMFKDPEVAKSAFD
jgi:hypothetical protein